MLCVYKLVCVGISMRRLRVSNSVQIGLVYSVEMNSLQSEFCLSSVMPSSLQALR